MEFVSWGDDIPNIWKNKIHVPNHQPDLYNVHQLGIHPTTKYWVYIEVNYSHY